MRRGRERLAARYARGAVARQPAVRHVREHEGEREQQLRHMPPAHRRLLRMLQASPPAEKVSAEVLEAGRRIGADAYEYVTSFAKDGWVPVSVLDKWLTRFNDKCRRSGLDWLAQAG